MRDPRRLLLTRPADQSASFAAALEEAAPGRFEMVVAPVLRLAAVPGGIDLSGAQGVLFTSANGVAHFAARTTERNLPALCVGAMTAAAAREIGLEARSAGGDVVALAEMAIAAYRPGAGAFVHVRGRQAAGDLLGQLAAAGVPGRAAEIYEQAPCPLSARARDFLAAGGIDVMALFSPRSAGLLAAELRAGGWDLSGVTAVALSAAAGAGLSGVTPGAWITAEAPTRAGMIAALAAL